MSYASDQISRISKRFSDKEYAEIILKGRGVPVKEVFSVDYILIDDLRQNEEIPTLTDQQRNNIIDQLL